MGSSRPHESGENFKLSWAEMEKRHRLTFETHEEGKLAFDEYLSYVVFYEKRTSPEPSFGVHLRPIESLPPVLN